MADFNLSGVVTLEDEGAVATGQNVERTIDGIAEAERRAASAAGTMGTATGEATNALKGQSGAAGSAADSLNRNERAALSNAKAQQAGAKAVAQQRAAMSQLNFQIQDVTQGIALGVSPFVILAQQGGQFFDALQNLLGAQTASADAMKAEGSAATGLASNLSNANRATTTLENKTAQLGAADVAATGTMTTLTRAASANATALDADAIAAGTAAGAQLELALVGGEGTAAMGANTGATNANTAAKDANAAAAAIDAGATGQLGAAEAGTAAAMGAATGATTANTGALEANTIGAGAAGAAQSRFGAAAMGVARFMATGWGAALIAAASIAGMFAMRVGEGSDAMKLAEVGADALGKAQSVLGGMFDLTSGKIEHQNALLVANARLTAINLRAEAMQKRASAAETFSDVREGGGGWVSQNVRQFLSWSRGTKSSEARNNLFGRHIDAILSAKTPQARAKAIDAALRATELKGNTADTDVIRNLTGVSGTEWRTALIDTATAAQNDSIAQLIDQSLDSGTLAAGLRRDGTRKKPPRPKKPRSTAPLEEFGEDAADKIASIAARFSGQPKLIEQAAAAMRQLDDLVDDINRKKPPNLKVLLADAEKARDAIREGVNRPYNDYILAQNDALRIQQLISQGRNDEAEALRQILSLEQAMGPLTPERKDAVLATVQALRAEQRETAILQEQQQKYLTALGSLKDAVYDVVRDPIEGLKNLPERLIGAFATLKADKLFEEMFGSTFREIEDSITGAKVAEDAAERMAGAVDEVSDQTNRTTDALGSLAQAATNAASAVAGGVGTGDRMGDLAGAVGGLGDDGGATAASDSFFDRLAGELGAAGVNPTATAGVPNAARDEDIVVTGSKSPTQSFSGWIEKLSRAVGIGDSQKDRDAKISDALSKGLKVGDDAASKIGKFAGKGIEGAATGAMINSFLAPLGKALGFKTSAMGAQIGGAVGSFVPIPFGKEIGAVVGSLAGGLMKTTKSGSASISSVYDPASASGNSKAMREASSAAATNIQDSILNIAEALGGELGAFKVSIGQRDGKWRVDPTGQGKTKTSKGALDFGDDSSAAMAAAVMDAIKDGAVTGLSPAISAALRSSSDVDRALREALKVRDLEELIGGLGSTLERQFNDFDRVAEERVRLAKKYGLDLLAVERINGEQRAKLIDDLIKSRIGSLLGFQNEMKFGDLFEGDAPTRRAALMEEIGKVRPKAEAGEDGAADQLADLYRRLISTSEEAFGTAGPELSADRESAAAAISRVIELENERIAAAAGEQAAQTAELVKNNTLTDETNNLISISITRLEEIIGKLPGGDPSSMDGQGLAKFARSTALALL